MVGDFKANMVDFIQGKPSEMIFSLARKTNLMAEYIIN